MRERDRYKDRERLRLRREKRKQERGSERQKYSMGERGDTERGRERVWKGNISPLGWYTADLPAGWGRGTRLFLGTVF